MPTTLLKPTSRGKVALRSARPDAKPRIYHNYLTTALGWYYTSGTIEKIYDDFLAFRGIDPKDVLAVMRERWPR